MSMNNNTTVYFENDYDTILWQEDIGCVIIEAKGEYHQGEEFRVAPEKVVELARTKNARCFLFNAHNAHVLSPEDQTWINETWVPRLRSTSIRTVAVVMPKSILAQMSLKHLHKSYKDELAETSKQNEEVEFFSELEKAKEWLSSRFMGNWGTQNAEAGQKF